MFQLYTDDEIYRQMSTYAKSSVSDEVSTVGSSLSWLYLATKLFKREKIDLNQRWVYELARAGCDENILPEENRLNK